MTDLGPLFSVPEVVELDEATPDAAILAHPLWPSLAPYFSAEAAGAGDARKQRYRIEVRRMPDALARQALRLEVPCCACGSGIHPIRERRLPGNKRDDVTGKGLYYACACPLSVNVGCSRGEHAKANYAAIVSAVQWGAP